jgi:hypothetical protein
MTIRMVPKPIRGADRPEPLEPRPNAQAVAYAKLSLRPIRVEVDRGLALTSIPGWRVTLTVRIASQDPCIGARIPVGASMYRPGNR